MTPPTPAASTSAGAELRRVVAASLVGTALEWYDFFIYGLAAALVLGDLFFPTASDPVQVLASFATFGVAFIFRPLGGFFFGRLGDRIGRRSTLVMTTLLMGFATGIVGLLPTYETAGVAAPILLVLARVCQGLGAGAEFGGASTLLAEHAPRGRRAYYASFVQTGVQLGLLTGTVAFLLVQLLGTEAVREWGWRLPFLASFVLIFVSLYVRLRVAESPVFLAMERNRTTVAAPVQTTLRRYPRSFLVGVGAHVCDTAVVYVYGTFMITYLVDEEHQSRAVALTGVILFSLVVIALQPVYGALADRIGRRPLNLFSVVFTAAFAVPLFLLVGTGQPVVIWLAMVTAMALGFAPMIAVQPIFYAELFGAGVRYTGFAASREIGAVVSGFSPLVAAALLRAGGGAPWLVAGWIILTALISLVAFLFSRETRDIDIAAPTITAPRAARRPGPPTPAGIPHEARAH
ncbi:MFS transporter [Phytohabitans sp. ZYX-F-186]|uniref:MFS transporter n=1 Tax=Phytohabitans maris TaxID=3071409 RepID=A0ABU0Z9P7_9ACTN|nr:MFS transporter [Phytohabitans sp. ZYX-F-186]MDQ7903126.1 MFS transporter [Phytohabitans sp. ZYX-F-186]